MKLNTSSELLISKQGRRVAPTPEVLEYLDTTLPQSGLYESLRTYDRTPFRLDQHLERLQQSAERMQYTLPASLDDIHTWVLDIIGQALFDPQFLKLVVSGDEVMVFSRRLVIDSSVYEGVRAVTVSLQRAHPEVKQLNVIAQQRARSQALRQGAYEALMVDNDGDIPEGVFSNLFWVREGQVFTRQKGALAGITQAAVMECAGSAPAVHEGVLGQTHLKMLDELFLTQTSRGIVPILQVDDKKIGNGTIGPLTKLFMERFEALIQCECEHFPSKNR